MNLSDFELLFVLAIPGIWNTASWQ